MERPPDPENEKTFVGLSKTSFLPSPQMKKLDWYILKKFLGTFFFAILIFAVLSVVIDITEKIDDFIEHGLTASYIATHYYIGFIPHILALLFPLFIFIAVIFFTSKLAYRSEIIAILSTGVSFHRFLRAYWVGGLLLALILGIANQQFIPIANEITVQFEDTYIHDKKKDIVLSNLHMRIDSERYISMRNYYSADTYGTDFTLETIDGQKMLSRLQTRTISWDSTKGGWQTGRAVLREMGENSIHVTEIRDTVLDLNLSPKDLQSNADLVTAMTTPELNDYIDHQKLRSTGGLNYLYVEKYRRTASAFSVVILTLIGVIIASRKVRGGSGLHLALGIVISAAYIVFMQFSTTFSVKGTLNPLIAVWIPNLLFGALAIFLYRRAPK